MLDLVKAAGAFDRFRYQQNAARVGAPAPAAAPATRNVLTPGLLAQLKAQQGIPAVYRTSPQMQSAIQMARGQGQQAARAAFGMSG